MEPLLALQELDGRIRELQQEIRDIPLRKDNEKSRLKDALERQAATQAELRAAKARVAEVELGVTAAREKVVKLRQQQMTLKTNREFRAMELEIETAQRDLESLEGDQIRAMDVIPPVKDRLAACDAKCSEEKSVVDGCLTELEDRLAEASEALGELEKQRALAARNVNAAHLRHYDRLRISRWPVVVKLDGTVCGGCHLSQPPSVGHILRRNTVLVACQMCGRILYV